MAITVKHSKVSTIPDDADTSLVRPSDWNADHTLVGTVPVANGGTGAATLTGYVIGNGTSAMTASTTIPSGDVSGLGTMATQNANAIAVTGGTINGTIIGATTASTGAFTYLSTSGSTSTTPTLSFNGSNSPIASGATIPNSYLQFILQNKSGTAGASTNYVLSNDLGTDSTYYGEFGMNSSVYSAGTPADFFSINNGIYYSGHDGDITVGSGNGYKTYLAWGTVGQSAHVINASGALGLNTNITGTTNFGTSGQVLTSAGSAATPTWANPTTGTVTSVSGTGTVSGISLSGTVTSSGNLTLGGALDLSSPPAIGATTPAAGTFTTITGQTEVLRGTGQNFLLQSQTFDSGSWAKSSSFITADQVAAPDGTTTADYFYATNPSASFPSVSQPFTCTTNQTYTFSLYVRSAERTTATIQVYGNSTTYINAVDATGLTSAWTRMTLTVNSSTYTSLQLRILFSGSSVTWSGSQGIYIWGAQAELASTAGTYLATTSAAVYGTPTLSFSGVAGLGLQSDGSLYVSPAGTGALQAQATTSSTVGGNARGANAVDWQTNRGSATQVASTTYTVVSGGTSNTCNGFAGAVVGGNSNQSSGSYTFTGAGRYNISSGPYSAIAGGENNLTTGYHNFIGGGYKNSGTANGAVTTQSGTMNATTAVTLSGSNANIKVGQYITGTSIQSDPPTYVAAISGTSLTLSQNASGSSTSTLSFYTPHGVVVGGGNNQATGSYSFIGGGGDAGTSANRNVASGDWSFVGGGQKNTASGIGSVVCGGGTNGSSTFANNATGNGSFIGGGYSNNASGARSSIVGGYANTASAGDSTAVGGAWATTRGISGQFAFGSTNNNVVGTAALGVIQSGLLMIGKQTTDATATVLTSDGGAASGSNQVILPNNSAYYFKVSVIANVTGGGNTKAWTLEGAIKRGSGVGTAAIVGTVTTTVIAADLGAATWTVTATADTTNGGLAITFTGQASTTIRVVARVDTTEVTF